MPVDDCSEPPIVKETSTPHGRAFVIEYAGYTDVFVYNDDPGESINNGIFTSNFEYSWARLRQNESIPDEIVLIAGNRLVISGCELFEANAVDSASVLRLGKELYISSDLGRSIKSI
jgi:hypothetical protein